MKKRGKQGQAAFEFTATYGWAILAALVAIGTLAYFGIFSPSKYSASKCSFTSQIICQDHILIFDSATSRPAVKFKLVNNLGTTVVIPDKGVTATDDASNALSCNLGNAAWEPDKPFTWNDGEAIDFIAICNINTGAFIIGNKNRVRISIKFYDPITGNSATHTVFGELYSEVQEATV